MKIAVCLSGYTRTLEDCLSKTIESVRQSNPSCEITVYAALWDTTFGKIDRVNDPWHSKSSTVTQDPPTASYIEKLIKESTVGDYSIKMLDHSVNEKMTEVGRRLNLNPPGLLSQYFSNQAAWEISSKSDADFFLRVRPDVILNSFPNLSEYDDCVIMNLHYWYEAIATLGMENEMFWVAHKNCAKKAFSLFDRLIEGSFPLSQTYGESVTGAHFMTIRCHIERFNFNYQVVR